MRVSLSLRRATILSAAIVGLSAATAAQAETVWAITNATAPQLLSFDSATPGTTSVPVTVTGIVAGQTLRSIDFRPSDGLLYGMSNAGTGTAAQLYTINTGTGVATAVGAGMTLTGNASALISTDWNPVADLLRVVTGSDQNFRISPAGTVAGTDTNVTFAVGDANAGDNPSVQGVAYTNNFPGAGSTTLYAYEFINDAICTVPTPNSGVLNTIGSTLPVSAFSTDVGFDISGATGIAYLNMDDFPSPTALDEFYTINLTNGAATLQGVSPFNLLDISIIPVPEPTSLGLAAIAGLGLLARRRA